MKDKKQRQFYMSTNFDTKLEKRSKSKTNKSPGYKTNRSD